MRFSGAKLGGDTWPLHNLSAISRSGGTVRFGSGSGPLAPNAEPEPGVRFGESPNLEPERTFGFGSAFERVRTQRRSAISGTQFLILSHSI